MNQALENEKARARIWEQMAKRVCEANNFSVSQTDNVFYLAREIDISSFAAGEKAGVESMVSGIRSSHKALSLRELKIVGMRFGFTDGIHHTQEEVGREFGVKRERIGQIEATALGRLRSAALK